jgi:CTP:phosphocholine cytidylyltransferase-like protein
MARSTRTHISTTIHPDSRPISVIIPAAGLGTRMKSYGPKSLIKIKNELTIIDNQLKYINKYLHKPEIIVVTGFESDKIKNHLKRRRSVRTVYNPAWETSNVVSSIGCGLAEAKNDNVLIVYGDLVFNAYAMKIPMSINSMIITDSGSYMKSDEVGCVVNSNTLEQMMYGLDDKWAQICYLTGYELKMMKELCCNTKYENYYGFEIINQIINSGGVFSTFAPKNIKITDVDTSKDLQKVKYIL